MPDDHETPTGRPTVTQARDTVPEVSWAERAADQSPVVRRSRARGVEQATAIVRAAQRLIVVKGSAFTTQELVKEAGIALKTFYRYFSGKDQLILAVIEEMVGESCIGFKEEARHLDDPIARLRFYVTAVVTAVGVGGNDSQSARFITAEHWRLQSLYPLEVAVATKPFTDLLHEEIVVATDAGLLRPVDPAYSAWIVTQLAMAVFHYYAFAGPDGPLEEIADQLWEFCVGGLGVGSHGDGAGDKRRALQPLDRRQSGY
ncbi:MAG TPA: TetR/AcrR family transcriptional regulator [Acidimicrobiales bacterium]